MCSVISLAFTVGFSIFLIAFLDWTRLVKCHDEHSCHKLSNYVVSHPFEHSSPHAVSAMVYMILCISYWMWKCGESIYTISSAIEMDCFYRDRLGITGELQNIKWNEVLERLIRLHEKRIFRVAVKEELSEHDVVSRIMRKDNYMVALINKGLLNLKSPWWLSPFVGADSLVLTQSLEWSLNYCILDHMFDDQSFTVSSTFLKDRQGLEWRFVMMGIIHFLLLPFLLVFMIIHFFLQNAQTFHTSKAYLGPRQWSPLALWTFREFNELPHIFEERIHKSVAPTQEYIGLFQNPYLSQIAKCVSYVAGALVATLVLVSFVDEGILLYVQALDHNLFWYLGVFSAIFATARAIIPDESKFVTQSSMISPTKDPEELVRIFSAHTHTMRNEWMGKCHTDKVFNEVSELFPYKVHIFAMEIYSVIITPIVLCFSLPSCTGNIIRFIR